MNFIRRFLGFKNATNTVIPKGQRVIIVEGALSGFEGTVIQQYKAGILMYQ